MNYFKFGIHAAGSGGNYTGFGDYIAAMRDAGKPAVVFAVDNSGPAEAVQNLARPFDVIGFRMTGRAGETLDLLDYHTNPIAFAQQRFERTAVHWPRELDATRVWTTPCNEPSKEASEANWLAAFTLEYARLSVASGRRFAAYGWSMGTPEPWFWQLPDTMTFLRLCAQHPTLLAVNLHEYSGTGNLQDGHPWLIGRFAALHDVCDAAGIARPNIIVGEFGWAENELRPSPGTFASQLAWAQELYAHPNILGAAIWTLGVWHGSVANDLAGYMPTLTALASSYVGGPTPPPPPPPPPPGGAHRAIVAKLPQQMSDAEYMAAVQAIRPFRHTITQSHDDMMTVLRGGNAESYVKSAYPGRDAQALALVTAAGYRWEVIPGFEDPPPPSAVRLVYRPCDTDRVTQRFGVNPDRYAPLPGHDGLDYGVAMGWPYYAAAAGRVVHASDRRWTSNVASAYGWHVVLDHGDYCTVYAHARAGLPVQVGQVVPAGHIVGYSGNTGNSDGYHLHFALLDKTGTIDPGNGFPMWHYGRAVNPAPFLAGLLPPPPPPPPTETINVLPYLRGRDRVQFDLAYPGGTQTTQVRHLPNDRFLYVKGEPAEYECLAVRTHNGAPWIFRYEDTSESQTRFYAQFRSQGGPIGAPWVPAHMEVGRWYETAKFVQHYNKTLVNGVWQGGCTPANSGNVVDKIRLMGRPYQRTYQQSGVTLTVITLEWASGEQYDFSEQFGNVGFRDPQRNFWFMSGPLEGRPDKPFVKPTCIDVGW
jgi:murein DD-endopeptidase MepM/ murein hydrolase activator NlpD